MNKIIFIMIVCGLVFGASCTNNQPSVVKINESDANSTIELHVGDKLEVSLEGNPTTGYNWSVEPQAESILKQVGEIEFIQSQKNQSLVGAGGTILIHFEAVKSGKTSLKLIYHRPWEKDIPPIKTYKVNIVVRKKK